jgi:hypothetical protein
LSGIHVLERSLLRLEHRVRARHASTLQPLDRLAATWVGEGPLGRALRVRGADVLVLADDRFEAPATPPAVRITVGDSSLLPRLGHASVDVELDRLELFADFEPAAMALVVRLIHANGTPSEGRPVEARGIGGTTIPLAADPAAPGTYRTPARVWSAAFNPLDVLVGGTVIRRVAIDFRRSETRITLVDPA